MFWVVTEVDWLVGCVFGCMCECSVVDDDDGGGGGGDGETTYSVEYARSGRAMCRGCRALIPNRALRWAKTSRDGYEHYVRVRFPHPPPPLHCMLWG